MLVARGLSNKEIAIDLEIELSTVKTHLHNLLKKLHVTRRSQIVAMVCTQFGGHSQAT